MGTGGGVSGVEAGAVGVFGEAWGAVWGYLEFFGVWCAVCGGESSGVGEGGFAGAGGGVLEGAGAAAFEGDIGGGIADGGGGGAPGAAADDDAGVSFAGGGELCGGGAGMRGAGSWKVEVGSWEERRTIYPTRDDAVDVVDRGAGVVRDDVGGETELVRRSMETLVGGFGRAVVPWGKLLSKLPIKSTRELARARDELRGLIGRMIATKRSGGEGTKGDLLTMLIAATDPESAVRLTDEQLVDQAVTILTAGHETTANGMTFTLWLLAKHPEEQRRLREEILAAMGDGEIGADVMERVPRMKWVLSESMRVLPPVWTVGRQNQRAIELGGYRLKAKCTVLAPQWVLHRDKRWWGEDAGEFRPERWRSPSHPRFAYFPFSTGPRNCIGEAFAWLEMAMALAMLVRGFEFGLTEDTPDPITLMPSITLRPRCILKLKVTRRV